MPEGEISVTGKDILEEIARQSCIHKKSVEKEDFGWWKYQELYKEKCTEEDFEFKKCAESTITDLVRYVRLPPACDKLCF